MKNFGLIGVAGYIAPKHMQAIEATGNRLVAALDKHDSVGIIDRYAPDARFFTEFERFDRFLEKQRHVAGGEPIDFLSVCSPNYLHDAHCRLALRLKADAICEKPLVINPWNLDQLRELEAEYGRRVYTVLQLRQHDEVVKLKHESEQQSSGVRADIELTYVTRRGRWYQQSWKGDSQKSGGLAMNIGIHFFDFLLWVFGACDRSEVHLSMETRMSGVLELQRARVKWFLSIDESDLPKAVRQNGGYAYRSIRMDGEEVDLSAGFTDLHTEVYRELLAGRGTGIDDAQPAIELVHQIRHGDVVTPGDFAHGLMSDSHPAS